MFFYSGCGRPVGRPVFYYSGCGRPVGRPVFYYSGCGKPVGRPVHAHNTVKVHTKALGPVVGKKEQI